MRNGELYELINYLRRNVDKEVSPVVISKSLKWPKNKISRYLEELKEINIIKKKISKEEEIYYLYPTTRLNLWLTLAAQHEWKNYIEGRGKILNDVVLKVIERLTDILGDNLYFIIYYGEQEINEDIKEGTINLFVIIKNIKEKYIQVERCFKSIYLEYGVRIKAITSDLNSFAKSIKENDDNVGKAVFKTGNIIYGYDKCWEFIKNVFMLG